MANSAGVVSTGAGATQAGGTGADCLASRADRRASRAARRTDTAAPSSAGLSPAKPASSHCRAKLVTVRPCDSATERIRVRKSAETWMLSCVRTRGTIGQGRPRPQIIRGTLQNGQVLLPLFEPTDYQVLQVRSYRPISSNFQDKSKGKKGGGNPVTAVVLRESSL